MHPISPTSISHKHPPRRGGLRIWPVAADRTAALCCAVVLSACVTPLSHAGCADKNALVSEDAGDLDDLTSAPAIANRQYIEFVPDGNTPSAKTIRITYTGSPIGSPRITANVPLRKPSRAASLAYTVKFEKDFQFVRGGKLPGLGPEWPTTGGRPVKPSGWSVRPVFRGDGTLGLYIYHQDMRRRYGSAGSVISRYPVSLGLEHTVELRVTLNSSPQTFDGRASLFVDGRLIEEADGLRYFSSEKPAPISRLLFHTFFGGSDPSYAPRFDGKFATVHAWFDHIKVCDLAHS